MLKDYRPRLSVVLDSDIHERLNKVLEGWRIKNALFEKITSDLVEVMERMTPKQRRFFIVSIIEGQLKPEQYIKSVKKVMEEK